MTKTSTDRINELKRLSKAQLKREVELSRRIVDLRGVGRDLLISMILEDEGYFRRCGK